MENTKISNSTMDSHDTLFQVGKHNLKNGWVLTVSEYQGHYEIGKQGVYGVWAVRDTGGGFGDGNWTIRILKSVGADNNYINVEGGFTLEVVNSIIDTMGILMAKNNIIDYAYKTVEKSIPERFKLITRRLICNKFK